MRMRGITVDYDAVLTVLSLPYEERVKHLQNTLPPLWQKAYRKMAQSPTSIHQFSQHGFDFLFDRASELRAKGVVSGERAVEDRIVVAYGRSTATSARNSNGSKRNLLGAAAARFGDNAERPYMTDCVLGGTLDTSLRFRVRHLSLNSNQAFSNRPHVVWEQAIRVCCANSTTSSFCCPLRSPVYLPQVRGSK